MATRAEVIRLADTSRAKYELAWGDDTAYPGYRPLPDASMPESFGHCSLATCEFFGELRDEHPEENLRIATGVWLQAGIVAGAVVQRRLTPKGHVLIDRRHPAWGRGGVVDVTFDQTRCNILPNTKVLVASHIALERLGIIFRVDSGGFYDSVAAFMAGRSAAARDEERGRRFQSRLSLV